MSYKTLIDSVVRLGQDVFGESCSYTPNGETAVVIKGIFTNAWVNVEGIVSLKPTLRIRLADLPQGPSRGDTVIVDDINYRVSESQVDGHGGSTLILQKA